MAPLTSKYKSILQGIVDVYAKKVKPVEDYYKFESFFSSSLSEGEIEAKPMVLLLGQYSTGKTTFIKKILGQPYPGAHIGPEPTVGQKYRMNLCKAIFVDSHHAWLSSLCAFHYFISLD